MREQNATAQRLAEFLQAHPAVGQVNYPGLPAHPQHERAARLFHGFGGMLSFELEGGVAEADSFMNALTFPAHAASLGGAESLVVRPAVTSHAGLTPQERARSGISDTLVRLSVGLEDVEDLIRDLEQALGG
jgi:cystathionine beta-lyase/cystathionine gamma-synthase